MSPACPAKARALLTLFSAAISLCLAGCGGGSGTDAGAQPTVPAIASTPAPSPNPTQTAVVKHVFVIAMENTNWTQPATFQLAPQIFGNEAAPFINSLVTKGHPNAAQVSFASNYLNVVTAGQSLHPSEPNYVWAEAAVAGPLDDADPYPSNIVTAPSLSAALAAAGKSWRSYQEDIDLAPDASGLLTNNVLPESQWTVPLTSRAGSSAAYVNAYNGSHEYDYAAKHNPQIFFTATNGGTVSTPDRTPGNPQVRNYVPLQRLASDLASGNVADYNWITPNQFNDMHTPLPGGFPYQGKTHTGDQARIAQGDNFLAQVVPMIMASAVYKDGGLILIWTDETEGETLATRAQFTIMEILISPLAKGNAYNGGALYDHTSDLLTMKRIFGLTGFQVSGATPTNDLSDLLKAGAVPPL